MGALWSVTSTSTKSRYSRDGLKGSVTSKVGSLDYVVDHLDFLLIGGEAEGPQLPQHACLIMESLSITKPGRANRTRRCGYGLT